ncbi:nitroreductase [Tsukamurella pulmonis]|uniref:nitroreductase family protein n=1 Tax=Tsukamurella pulmonis TaxID=47312 RepID=UPI000792C84C|nr:nitroreductase family protein [Tsukamurella pulmonis]KXP13627.1 nitroreductase [Tsukamurella pulmonis]
MSACAIPVVPEVHPAVLRRHSPMLFDSGATISDAAVDTILDAGRLAPSAGNSQPWAFVVGRRGDAVHTRIVRHLAGSSARWAPGASMIVVNLARVLLDDPDAIYSDFAHYDLGQAVAHMTLQALSIGVDAHQFRAFDQDAVAAEFDVPREWEVTTMTAFGVAAHAPGAVVGVSRERRERDEVTWARA